MKRLMSPEDIPANGKRCYLEERYICLGLNLFLIHTHPNPFGTSVYVCMCVCVRARVCMYVCVCVCAAVSWRLASARSSQDENPKARVHLSSTGRHLEKTLNRRRYWIKSYVIKYDVLMLQIACLVFCALHNIMCTSITCVITFLYY